MNHGCGIQRGCRISTIYRHVYNTIRKWIHYRVRTENAVEVIRVTELDRKQNPAIQLPGRSSMEA
ncbi:MAG: hypothetical protein J6S58_07610 [Lentisphaeria bacterium]|nr:hypothetical protein [Lentisphaeria bacterium]